MILSLKHTNGDKREVTIQTALPFGKFIVLWGDLCGAYVFDIKRNMLYPLGPSDGIRWRKPLGWSVEDQREAWRMWHQKREETKTT